MSSALLECKTIVPKIQGRCGVCKHWGTEEYMDSNWGKCSKVDNSDLFQLDLYACFPSGILATRKSFGCVCYESKVDSQKHSAGVEE
jgi:hypothetical protein